MTAVTVRSELQFDRWSLIVPFRPHLYPPSSQPRASRVARLYPATLTACCEPPQPEISGQKHTHTHTQTHTTHRRTHTHHTHTHTPHTHKHTHTHTTHTHTHTNTQTQTHTHTHTRLQQSCMCLKNLSKRSFIYEFLPLLRSEWMSNLYGSLYGIRMRKRKKKNYFITQNSCRI